MPTIILFVIGALMLVGFYYFRTGPSAMSPMARLAVWFGVMVALVLGYYFFGGGSHA